LVDFYRTLNRTEKWLLFSDNETENGRTNFRIEQTEYARSVTTSSVFTEQFRLRLDNNYRFGESNELSSALLYFDSEGQGSSRSTSRVSSRLSLAHQKNFNSYYSASFSESEAFGQPDRSRVLSVALSHQLYENLNTSISFSGTNSNSVAGSMDTYDGTLRLAYSRRIPWGRLSLEYRNRQAVRDNQQEAMYVNAQDEPYVFEGISTSIILDRANIDSDSIELTDDTGLVTYMLGADYEIDVVANTIVITRFSLGEIGDDQKVLVSYRFVPNPPAKTDFWENGFGASLSLGDKVRLYYRKSKAYERVIEGMPPEFPIDTESMTTGARLSLGWSTTDLIFSNRESNRNPQKEIAIRETIGISLTPAISINISAEARQMELKDTGEDQDNIGISASLSWRLRAGKSFKASAYFRRHESILRLREIKGLTANYKWRYGAWRSELMLQLNDTKNEYAGNGWGRQYLSFRTMRRFN